MKPSRTRNFAKALIGPHAAIAFLAGLARGVAVSAGHVPNGYPLSDLIGGAAPCRILLPILLGFAAASAAILAKRLTGNTLVSACAGALLVLDPLAWMRFPGPHPRWAAFGPVGGDVLATALGLLAAGVRLLPDAAHLGLPLLGRREVLAVGLLAAGAFSGPAILAMPVLILLADLACASGGLATVLRRTGALFLLHGLAVVPAAFFLSAVPHQIWTRVVGSDEVVARHYLGGTLESGFGALLTVSAAVLACGLLVLLRPRISQTLVISGLLALGWTAVAELPRLVVPADRHYQHSLLAHFGFALLIPTILWRIAIAATQVRGGDSAEEAPIPSVPALRDFIRGIREEPRPPAPAPSQRFDPSTGLRSTVESAVAGAVSGALEQIRLAFREPEAGEPPAPPAQVLWNRLLTGTSGGAGPAEQPADAVARWRSTFSKDIAPRIKEGGDVLCAGPTPWPLVVAMAERQRSVTLVERGRRPAARAAEDLRGCGNVLVLRHDVGLASIKDASADAVVCMFEASTRIPAQILALLKDLKRILRPGGVAGLGFADLALRASQEALVRGAPSECFLNRPAVESLARLAGFGRCDYAPELLPTTSVAWLRVRPDPVAPRGSPS